MFNFIIKLARQMSVGEVLKDYGIVDTNLLFSSIPQSVRLLRCKKNGTEYWALEATMKSFLFFQTNWVFLTDDGLDKVFRSKQVLT